MLKYVSQCVSKWHYRYCCAFFLLVNAAAPFDGGPPVLQTLNGAWTRTSCFYFSQSTKRHCLPFSFSFTQSVCTKQRQLTLNANGNKSSCQLTLTNETCRERYNYAWTLNTYTHNHLLYSRQWLTFYLHRSIIKILSFLPLLLQVDIDITVD